MISNRWAQLAFSLIILLNPWLAPAEGCLVDRYGKRPAVMFGGVMAALSWAMNSRAHSLNLLYAAAVVPLLGMIQSDGRRHAFLTFGWISGISIFVLGALLPAKFMVVPMRRKLRFTLTAVPFSV